MSSFKGRENYNEFSIGIELEGTDENTYTEDQYHALIDITKELMLIFPDIKKKTLLGILILHLAEKRILERHLTGNIIV